MSFMLEPLTGLLLVASGLHTVWNEAQKNGITCLSLRDDCVPARDQTGARIPLCHSSFPSLNATQGNIPGPK